MFATMFPTMSEAITGQRITVGPPFFNKWMVPIGLVLLLLTGIGPLLAWRRSSLGNLVYQFAWPVGLAVATALGLVAIRIPGVGFRTVLCVLRVRAGNDWAGIHPWRTGAARGDRHGLRHCVDRSGHAVAPSIRWIRHPRRDRPDVPRVRRNRIQAGPAGPHEPRWTSWRSGSLPSSTSD